jgi:hypothetical protein
VTLFYGVPAITFNEDRSFAAQIFCLLSQNTKKASNMTAIKSGFSPHIVENLFIFPTNFPWLFVQDKFLTRAA